MSPMDREEMTIELQSLLIVDDNAADSYLLEKHISKVFSDRELRIEKAETLTKALEQLELQNFDLIALDLFLPDTTELESITAIRVKAPKTPIILFSGHEDEETSKKALRLGAQDYLIKGKFDQPDQLRWSIQSALQRQNTYNRLFERQKSEQDLNEVKNKILSLTAHDIRSPLAGVASFLEKILSGGMIKGLSEDQKRIFRMMLKNCEEVVRMADNLADAERGRSQVFNVQIEKVDLESFIEETYELVKDSFSSKKIDLSYDLKNAPRNGHFDPFLVRRALQNLLSNAARHSPYASEVKLVVEGLQDKVAFSVIDEGTGLEPHIIEKCLAGKIESKVSQKSSKDQRIGLGLRIVDQIARSHSGGLLVKTRTDKDGSIFTLEIQNDSSEEIKPEIPCSVTQSDSLPDTFQKSRKHET